MSVRAFETRGILKPAAVEQVFTLARHSPPANLAAFVERFWLVRWDLRGKPPYEQETLPYPCVNLVFGTHREGLHGVCTTRFVAHLEGEGWGLGVKFRPGGFRPFWHEEVSALRDRALDFGEAFGPDGEAVARAVKEARSDEARLGLVSAFLAARVPKSDDLKAVERVASLVQLLECSPTLTRVEALAEHAGISMRMMQRLFHEYVGVSPKWVIRRFRVHEATAQAAKGVDVDWASLAQELGYVDQAHFIREFKEQVGDTPQSYATLCARGVS